MQPVPIAKFSLAQVNAFLRLIDRGQIDGEKVTTLLLEHIPAFAPHVDTADGAEIAVRIGIARFGRFGLGSVVVHFVP